jgi:hypothetical protein
MNSVRFVACSVLVAASLVAGAQTAQAGHHHHGKLHASLHVGKSLHLHNGHLGLHLHKPHVHKPLHVWHDTSHWDYHPGEWVWNGYRWVYVPGHYDYHVDGHFDHLH